MNEQARDPVCGMRVDLDGPRVHEHGDETYRFCCAGCVPKAKADPAKYIDAIDAAWQANGRYVPAKDTMEGDAP